VQSIADRCSGHLVLGYVGLVVGLILLAIGVITTLIIASARSQGLAR